MKLIRSFYLATLATATLTSCGSIRNLAVPEMDTAISLKTEKKQPIGEDAFKHWAHADLATDTIPGMSVEKAYEFLEGKTGETVIVGVIDSGIDIAHEDLKEVLWTNPKEVADNGIDDDKNGYIDDVHGWNFLGGNGDPAPEQLEITRLVDKWKPFFKGVTAENVTEDQKVGFERYQRYLKAYQQSSARYFKTMERLVEIDESFAAIKKFLGKETVTIEALRAVKPADQKLQAQIGDILNLLSRGFTEAAFLDYYHEQQKSKHYIPNFDGRAIVGDVPGDINDTTYGNPFVIGDTKTESHGTHVSGIILAARNNGIGMNGVANNAVLMSIRAVPDGDERDKDVALAIRYAVDNGAKVVNMSFGKSWSPYRHWVFEAIKYAEKHDVLLVHAAGNDGKDIDVQDNWPNDSMDKISEIADNVLTVGAISVNYNEKLLASFTNYGQRNVDVFAPGVHIYSTMPENQYAEMSGTSMAAPEVAGIATLLRSYYPELSASQVKHVIMNSGTPLAMEVLVPKAKGTKTALENLSVSGRMANAYQALKLADKMVQGE